MARNLVEVSTFTTPVTVPENGEPARRETEDPPLQALANRTKFLDDARAAHDGRITTLEGYDADNRLDALEARFDGSGRVLLPAPIVVEKYLGLPDALAISGWTTTDSFEWVSNANGAEMVWEIRPHFSPLAVLSQIGVLLDPGAARAPGGSYTIGDTMQIALRKSVHTFTAGTPTRTVSTHDTDEDDGTTNLQWAWFNVTGGPTIGSAHSWQVRVKSSIADSDTSPDKVYGLYVKCTVDRLDAT